MKRFRIPDEDVELDDVEVELTQTKAFQRLFSLKQLGVAYLVYPGACHTRATHSLYCVMEAKKILKAVGRDTGDDADAVRAAALLHDIGHAPFSHMLEDENVVLSGHDGPERIVRVLGKMREQLGSAEAKARVDQAEAIMVKIGTDESDWRADLIGNTVCADLLAYIRMDSQWAGLEKRPGYYRLYDYFRVEKNHLCVKLTKGGLRTDVFSSIMDLLDMRYALFERIAFHHAKLVASAMLARAARLAKLSEETNLGTADAPLEVTDVGDELFLYLLRRRAEELDEAGALRILDALESRRLFQRVFKVNSMDRDEWDRAHTDGLFCDTWRSPERAERLLREIEEELSLDCGALAVWCPKQNASMKLVEANVVWDGAPSHEGTEGLLHGPEKLNSDAVRKQFPGVYERVQTVEQQYHGLWAFYVAADRRYSARYPEIYDALESRLRIACDRMFFETYLKPMDAFKERAALCRMVEPALRAVRGGTYRSLEDQAALDGADDVGSAQVLQTIASEASGLLTKAHPGSPRRPKHKATRKPIETEAPLFDDGDNTAEGDKGLL